MAEQETLTEPEEKASWQYTPSAASDSKFQMAPETGDSSSDTPRGADTTSVSWTAAEYIEHEHNFGWYLLLALATVALSAGVYFLTKEYFAGGTIALIGVIVGIFAVRKPQQITYELSSSGLKVGQKQYAYSLFKSFSVIKDEGHNSLNLMPLKRFMPPVSAYFDPANEQKIVDAMSHYLPYEERQADGIDRLSRKLKL